MMDQGVADDDLACQALVELVTDYLEEALPAATRRRFKRQLAGCAGCRIYLTQSAQTIRAARAFGVASLPPADRAALLALFRDWGHGSVEQNGR
jgi:putative zinc finger protein